MAGKVRGAKGEGGSKDKTHEAMTLFPIDWSLAHWRWLHEQARDRGGVKDREGEAGCLPPSSWREWGKWSATTLDS